MNWTGTIRRQGWPLRWEPIAILGLLATSALLSAEKVSAPLAIARPTRTDRVSFHREILPVLQANCLPCHNQTRAKGDLILETPETMFKGGDSGPAIVPGKAAESRLLQTAAHQLEDLVMPPAGNKVNARELTPEELGILWLWIEQGANAEAAEATVVNWRPFPTNWVSSFAVSLASDGQSVAVARANRVYLYDPRSGLPLGQLADPALSGAAQRDWVSALAFSPDGEQLAAAGFREVRIWERQPVTFEPAWEAVPGTTWMAAAFSNDRSRVACVTDSGGLEIRNVRDGSVVRSLPVRFAPPVRLAWSGNGKYLACAGTEGVLQVVRAESEDKPILQLLGGEAAALAWFDQDRQLATVVSGTRTIQTWRLPDSLQISTNLEATGGREGHAGAVVALAADSSQPGSFVSAGADGSVRRWFPDPLAAPQETKVEGSIIRLDFVGPGARYAAGLAAGGTALLSFEDTAKIAGTFRGDPRLSSTLAGFEGELGLSRFELARAGTLIQEADSASKASDETIKKAREKHESHVKALADKEKDLNQQRETEIAAAKQRDEFGAELQRIVDAAQVADKALEEARATAKATAEQDGAAQVAASAAERLKAELEKLASGLPEAPSEAAIKTREAATAAAAEAAARSAQRAEARARAEQAREELASRAFTAGERKGEAARAQAELPPRKKQAEERLAAAQKAIKDLQSQVEKARITRDGSAQDVALAEKSVARAAEALGEARAADEKARKRIAIAEAQVAETRAAMELALAAPVTGFAATPSGTAIVTVGTNGLASRWSISSGMATATFTLPHGTPLAIAGLSDHEFIVVHSNTVLRVDAARSWTLQRTLGGAESSPNSGPFIDRVNALAFSPDGQLLATGGGEPSRAGELKIWRVSDGGLVRDLGGIHSDCVMAVSFSPRGEWLATGGADRFARITPVASDGPRVNLEGHTQHVLDVAWLADGSTLATAGAEGMVKLWNPKTGERRKNVEGFGKEVTGLRAVGVTNEFVAVSGSGQGRIFRADGEKVRDLASVPSFLHAVSVTRNGSLIAAVGDDGTCRLWEVQTGKVQLSLPPQ